MLNWLLQRQDTFCIVLRPFMEKMTDKEWRTNVTKGYKRKDISSPATVSQPILADPGEASGSQMQASGL